MVFSLIKWLSPPLPHQMSASSPSPRSISNTTSLVFSYVSCRVKSLFCNSKSEMPKDRHWWPSCLIGSQEVDSQPGGLKVLVSEVSPNNNTEPLENTRIMLIIANLTRNLHVPGALLITLYKLIHLIFTRTSQSRYNDICSLIDKETTAQVQ